MWKLEKTFHRFPQNQPFSHSAWPRPNFTTLLPSRKFTLSTLNPLNSNSYSSKKWLNPCPNGYKSKGSTHYFSSSSSNAISLAKMIELIKTEPMEKIRNFSIIAHIDHGKSTLADRLLELSGNITPIVNKTEGQILDSLQVERERGITVKAQTASMLWNYNNNNNLEDGQGTIGKEDYYHLNLIDTPGHVDFSYEVSRSFAACQGALLLIDSSQGIQAQTLANYDKALKANLDIIPLLTKIDLPHADIERCKDQLQSSFGIDPSNVLTVSSKSGLGIQTIFPSIIQKIRPPKGDLDGPFRGLLFDSWFDIHRGVVCLINVVDGYVAKGDRIASYHGGGVFEVQEVGVLLPSATAVDLLKAGQVGYVIAGIKNSRDVRLGETFFKLASKIRARPTPYSSILQLKYKSSTDSNHLYTESALGIVSDSSKIQPLPGFEPAKSMVFAGLFPCDNADLNTLTAAIEKLCLNDASVTIEKETSLALGTGFRCGFLGILHLDVFSSRLEQEFGESVIITAPTVPYIAVMKDGTEIRMDSPNKFPDSNVNVKCFREPMILASIIAPSNCLGALTNLWTSHRGELIEMANIGSGNDRLNIKVALPLSEIVIDFYDSVKSISSGYASFDYEEFGWQETELVRLNILVNSEVVDALSCICNKDAAVERGKKLTAKLKEVVDRQSFEIIIQAAIGPPGVGAKIVARERISPFRKDVLVKGGKTVGGGDVTRKRKLLDKQKEGKKKMKMIGEVEMGHHVFKEVMRIR